MKSNEEQKKRHQQNTSGDGRVDFDRQIKNMLEDASLTPPPDSFERIESALEEENEFKGAKPANNIKAGLPKQDSKGIIIPIKGFRRKWSYAASIGVLILLSLGFWKLNLFTGKDQPITSVLNPNTLLSHGDGQKGQQEVTKVTGDSSVGNQVSGKTPFGTTQMTDIKPDQSNDLAEATLPIQSNETDRKSANTSGNQPSKKVVTYADNIIKKPGAVKKANSAERAETGLVTGTVETNSQETLNERIRPIENKQPPSKAVAASADPVKNVSAQNNAKNDQPVSNQVTDQVADLDPGLSAESIPEGPAIDVKASKKLVAKADSPEEVQSENGRREKGRLFRGLVNHFKQRVDEISDEVVSGDNNKTIIKVGCIAITTFK